MLESRCTILISIDRDSASSLSQYTDKLMGDKSKLSEQNWPTISSDISQFMQHAGVSGDVKPEEVIKTAIGSTNGASTAKSWDGRSLDDWTKRPPGRPGTAEPVSPSQQFSPLVSLDQLSSAVSGKLPKRKSYIITGLGTILRGMLTCISNLAMKPDQETKVISWLVDKSAQGPEEMQAAVKMMTTKLGEDDQWVPEASTLPSTTGSSSQSGSEAGSTGQGNGGD